MLSLNKIIILFLLILSISCIPFASAEQISLLPVEDTYVNSNNPDIIYANDSNLFTITTTPNSAYSYLKFYLDTHANNSELFVYVTNTYGGTLDLYTTSCEWNESIMTWDSNRPQVEYSNRVDSIEASTPNQWYSFNVSSVVDSPGYYSFKIKSGYADHSTISSSSSESNKPYLRISPYNFSDIVFNNKTLNDDLSFLVNPEDSVLFRIDPPNSTKIVGYAWSVNKIGQEVSGQNFSFKIPKSDYSFPSNNIWEIRVEVSYEDESTLYREWLISSLPESKAPDFIEYFTDLNNNERNGYEKDPWGRMFPNYDQQQNFVNKGYLTDGDSSSGKYLTTNFDITYGTFIFRVQNSGTKDIFRFRVTGTPENTYKDSSIKKPPYWTVEWTAEEFHDYFGIVSKRIGFDDPAGRFEWGAYIPISRRGLGQAPSAHWWRDEGWHEVVVIHSPDGWWSIWDNGILLPQSFCNFDDAFNYATELQLIANSNVKMDCIEVYEDQFLYPANSIYYGWYPKWWKIGDSGTGHFIPIDDFGINIFGRDVTLEEISNNIDNESIFVYNSQSKVAISYVDLSLRAGSSLYMENETLLFETSEEEKDFSIKNSASLFIYNSTISTTDAKLMRWNIASSASQTIFDPDANRNASEMTRTSRNIPFSDYNGRFIIENSVINNTGNLFLDGASEIIINNTIFSNHHSIDYGDYRLRGTYVNHNNKKYQSMGDKALWITPRLDLNSFIINNITFENPADDIDFKVVGGEWIQNTTKIKNSNLTNIFISAKKATKYEYFINYREDDEASSISLINCLFNEDNLRVETSQSQIMVDYYTDILVENINGDPVDNAVITISNDNSQDDSYQAKNVYEYDAYISDAFGPGMGGVSNYDKSNPQYEQYSGGTYKRWYNLQLLDLSLTERNGHTPLPNEDANRSIILTDFVLMNSTGNLQKTEFSYTFNIVTPSEALISLSSINPDSGWYRSSHLSNYTIVAVMSNGTSNITPSIIGYAPSKPNLMDSKGAIKFQVWTNQPMDTNVWKLDGDVVSTDSQFWLCDDIPQDGYIVYEGTNSNGTITKTWDINSSSGSVVPAIIGAFPGTSTLSQELGISTDFSVTADQSMTSMVWYKNDEIIAEGAMFTTVDWEESGVYDIRFTGSNGNGFISRSWEVLVGINQAPVLGSLSTKTATETSPLTFNLAATDPDSTALVYSANNLPTGATLNSTTGEFSWTPSVGQAGNYSIIFEVTDGNLIDSETVSITVKSYPRWDVNRDGVANILDVTLVGQNMGTESLNPNLDVNQDSEVNIQDLTLVAQYFGETVE